MALQAVLFPEKSSADPSPSGTVPKISQQISFMYTSHAFQNAVCCAVSQAKLCREPTR